MTDNFYADIKYKKGYVLIHKSIADSAKINPTWKTLELQHDFVLFYAPENECRLEQGTDIFVCLLCNYCMDTDLFHMDVKDITLKLFNELNKSLEAFYEYLDCLNGRFVCIYEKDGAVCVLNDATGSKNIYYNKNKKIIGSHYNLVQDFSGEEEEKFWRIFCEWSEENRKAKQKMLELLPADLTPWSNIRMLLPNHYIDLGTMQHKRFFPRSNTLISDIDTVMKKIADNISGQMKCLNKRYKIIQGLTAGSDSRISLAASNVIKEDVTYFTYHNTLKDDSYSIKDRERNFNFAKNLCEKEHLDFKELILDNKPVDKELLEALEKNHYHRSLPKAISEYAKIFTENCIYVHSNLIEIIRKNPYVALNIVDKHTAAAEFAQISKFKKSNRNYEKALELFLKYYDDEEYDKLGNYPTLYMFYWEYRMGMWLSGAVLTEFDTVCEPYQLFNCRNLIKLGFAVPVAYRANREMLVDEVIKLLWSDLLNYNLPNTDLFPYSLICKWNINENISFLENKCSCISGNIYDLGRKVLYKYEPSIQKIFFGYSSCEIKKGDYVGLKICDSVLENKNYYYSFGIKTVYLQGSENGLSYEVYLNNNLIYSMSTRAFFYRNNIRYNFKAKSTGVNELVILLKSDRDLTGTVHNGVLEVSDIALKRDYGEEYSEPELLDTYSMLKSIHTPAEGSWRGLKNRLKKGAVLQNSGLWHCGISDYARTVTNVADVSKLERFRSERIYNYDKNYLAETDKIIDIDNIKELPNGRFKCFYKGIRFDFCFNYVKGAPLYVVLNGSRTGEYPEFKRWDWYHSFNGSMLNIADPSLNINPKLHLGWYYGTTEENYRQLVVEIVTKIAVFLKIKHNNIIFYGSSGGGAAALHCAGLLEGSTAVVINPQIYLNLYHYAAEFQKITGINLSQKDKWHRNDGSYYILNSPKSQFLIVENIQSEDDRIQFFELEKNMNKKFRYGINRFNNIGVWLYDAKPKNIPMHNAQEDQILYQSIDLLAKSLQTDDDWEDKKDIYMVITELWRKKWTLGGN